MRRSNSKLVAATPIAALVLAASATAAPLQSRSAVAVESAPAKASAGASAEEADDGCACTCAKCLEKHGPKAAPAADVPGAKAPVTIEIMQSSDDADAPEAARASDGPKVTTKTSWTIELAAPAEAEVVEEEPIIEEFEVSDHNETDTDQPFEAAEVDEVVELAREVEAILASELEVINGKVVAIDAAELERAQDSEETAPEDERGFIGVALGVDDDGVAVSEVMDGSPAEISGLKAGDVLFRVGQTSITSMDELREALAGTKPGDALVVGYMRDGRPHRTRVTLAQRDSVVAPAVAARRGSTAINSVPSEPAAEVEPPVDVAGPTPPRRGRDAAPRARDAAPRRRDAAPADGVDRSPLHAAQAATDARVQAVMSGDDLRIIVMADDSIRITGSNVRVQRHSDGGGTDVKSITRLDTRISPRRGGSLISWIRGAQNQPARGADARGGDARGGDAGSTRARGGDARGDDAAREDAALRRRIREMSAEIDLLSRRIQRIGRALDGR